MGDPFQQQAIWRLNSDGRIVSRVSFPATGDKVLYVARNADCPRYVSISSAFITQVYEKPADKNATALKPARYPGNNMSISCVSAMANMTKEATETAAATKAEAIKGDQQAVRKLASQQAVNTRNVQQQANVVDSNRGVLNTEA